MYTVRPVSYTHLIIDMFGEEPKILASLQKDPAITEREPQGSFEAGLLELYKKIRPGEPLSVESAESLITAMFFDPRRYDLAKDVYKRQS